MIGVVLDGGGRGREGARAAPRPRVAPSKLAVVAAVVGVGLVGDVAEGAAAGVDGAPVGLVVGEADRALFGGGPPIPLGDADGAAEGVGLPEGAVADGLERRGGAAWRSRNPRARGEGTYAGRRSDGLRVLRRVNYHGDCRPTEKRDVSCIYTTARRGVGRGAPCVAD